MVERFLEGDGKNSRRIFIERQRNDKERSFVRSFKKDYSMIFLAALPNGLVEFTAKRRVREISLKIFFFFNSYKLM